MEQVSHPGHRQSFQEVFSESRGQGKWKIKLLSVLTGNLRARCLKVKGKGVLGASETQRARQEEGKKRPATQATVSLTAWTRPRIMRGDLSDLWLTIEKRIKICRSKQVLKSLACLNRRHFF